MTTQNPFKAMYDAAVADGGVTPVSELAARFNITDMYFIVQVSQYARQNRQRIPMMNFPRRPPVRGPVIWEHGKPVVAVLNPDVSEESYRRGYCHGYQQAIADLEELVVARKRPLGVVMDWMSTFLVERLTHWWRFHKEQAFPLIPPELLLDLGEK